MQPQYWDSITKEDLEFSVGTKMNNWEVKEPFLSDIDGPNTQYGDQSEYNSSLYAQPVHHRVSGYDRY